MKYLLLAELALMLAAFGWAAQIYFTGRVADEQLGALFPFGIGCVIGAVFIVTLIVKAIID